MLGEWIVTGVALGVKAFFAALTFVAILGALLGIIGIFAGLIGGDDNEDEGEA